MATGLFNSTPIANNLQRPVAVSTASLTRLGGTAAIGIQPTKSMNSTTADGGFLSNVYGVFNSVLREQGLRREREFILKQQAQQNQQAINLETAQTGKILQDYRRGIQALTGTPQMSKAQTDQV